MVDIALADGEVEWKRRAVLTQPTHFPPDPDDPLVASLEIPLDIRVVLVPERRGHEKSDVFIKELVWRVSKDAFDGPIDLQDLARFIDDNDAIDRRIENST